jgi:CRP-like cAMP-binding protein
MLPLATFPSGRLPMKKLLTHIRTLTPFSEKSWEILLPALSPVEMEKGEYLVKEGEICQAIYFISAGYCKAFHTVDGEEKNTNFYLENEFATNIQSLTQHVPSTYFIQACESLRAVRFDKIKLLEAYRQSHEIESLGRKLLELVVAQQESQLAMFKLLSAQQRYEYLQKYKPALFQRVSLTQLSSYLGMSRETLSRIRSKRTQP